MTTKELAFVKFEPRDNGFIASASMDWVISSANDPELTLRKAADLYEKYIKEMILLIKGIQSLRKTRKPIPARKVWQIGNYIFSLKSDLEQLSLQVEDFYGQLVSALGVKRKWLEKVIIFRRYLPDIKFIPKNLNWGKCEKGTRKIAQKLFQFKRL